MCCENSGFCGSLIRILLTIINVVFLLLGISIFVVAAVLKWSKDSFIKQLLDDAEASLILDLTSFDEISIGLLVLSGAIIVVSIVGLIGACCASKFFLIIYEIVLVLLFFGQLALLIVVLVKAPEIEKSFKKELNETFASINEDNVVEKCKPLHVISEVFKCCGVNGPQDFDILPVELRDNCCFDMNYQKGCADKVVNDINNNSLEFIIIPNIVVLSVELIIIIAVPFLIGRLSKAKEEKYTSTYNNKNVAFNYNM